jgi:hypothetical protein
MNFMTCAVIEMSPADFENHAVAVECLDWHLGNRPSELTHATPR